MSSLLHLKLFHKQSENQSRHILSEHWIVCNVDAAWFLYLRTMDWECWKPSSPAKYFCHTNSYAPFSSIFKLSTWLENYRLVLTLPQHQISSNKNTITINLKMIIETSNPTYISVTFNLDIFMILMRQTSSWSFLQISKYANNNSPMRCTTNIKKLTNNIYSKR